jgi:histidinol-phosphate aminotransferase
VESILNRRQWIKKSVLATTGLWMTSVFPECERKRTVAQTGAGEIRAVKLNSNESPYGISPKASQALIDAIDRAPLYPHRQYPDLSAQIAEREGVTPEHVILGAGSTEVMNLVIHAYGRRGKILAADPTYFDFVFYAEQAGCSLDYTPLDESFGHDLPSLLEKIDGQTNLVYICNPNNPTGSITPYEDLSSFCELASKKTVLLIDEAYHEYVEDPSYGSMIGCIQREENVIITRTFSKIHGMAGLRIGYGLARPEVIKNLGRVQMNFAPIANTSLQAALASYKDAVFTQNVLKKNSSVKAYLYTQLDNLGYSYIPSLTNFVLFRVNREAKEVAENLGSKNVLVRPFRFFGNDWIRVSLGTMEDMKFFVSALSQME